MILTPTVPRLRAVVVSVLACIAFVVQAAEPSDDPGASASSASPSGSDDAEIARVLATADDVAWGEYLAGECAACHGAAPGDGAVPVIHGVDAARVAGALLEYRSGARTNTTMRSVAGALGDEEIAVLARYLAGAEPP